MIKKIFKILWNKFLLISCWRKKKPTVEIVTAGRFYIIGKGDDFNELALFRIKKMSKIVLLDAGESLPFNFDRGDNSIDGWTCTIFVKQRPSDTPFITRVITPIANEWPGFLTQSETAALSPGLYFLSAKLENTLTDEEEVIRERSRFKVNSAWT